MDKRTLTNIEWLQMSITKYNISEQNCIPIRMTTFKKAMIKKSDGQMHIDKYTVAENENYKISQIRAKLYSNKNDNIY